MACLCIARGAGSPVNGAQWILEKDALARIQSQMLLDDKRSFADVIINNDGTPDELYIQLEKLWHEKLLPLYNK